MITNVVRALFGTKSKTRVLMCERPLSTFRGFPVNSHLESSLVLAPGSLSEMREWLDKACLKSIGGVFNTKPPALPRLVFFSAIEIAAYEPHGFGRQFVFDDEFEDQIVGALRLLDFGNWYRQLAPLVAKEQ